MKNNKFALITPSYPPDFERCRLLCQSVKKYIDPAINHYIIVEKRDLDLFRQLERQNTKILIVESFIPWWVRRIPLVQKSWVSLKTIPVRNWIMQQIVKIAVAKEIDEEISVMVDSDVAFIRPFDSQHIIRDEKIRLFCDRQGNEIQRQWHDKWHKSANRLLGLPDVDPAIPDYIGHVISWKRQHVMEMCQHIEKVSGKPWMETLFNCWHLSEFVLYGIFVEKILQDKSSHYFESENLCHDYWFTESLSEEQLKQFFQGIRPEQVAIMISAKSGMSALEYSDLVEQMKSAW
jgi:Family of unknown function (DUF6492)